MSDLRTIVLLLDDYMWALMMMKIQETYNPHFVSLAYLRESRYFHERY